MNTCKCLVFLRPRHWIFLLGMEIKDGIGNECPIGTKKMSEEECKRVPMQIVGTSFKVADTVNQPNRPSKCFRWQDKIIWNPHETGAAIGGATPICRVDGKHMLVFLPFLNLLFMFMFKSLLMWCDAVTATTQKY